MGREAGTGTYGIDPQAGEVVRAVVLPTLSEVCSEPSRADDLPASAIVALLAQAASVEAQLTSALAQKLYANGAMPQPTTTPELITVQEAMKITGMRARWFYQRTGNKRFGFIKKLSARTVRVDKAALLAWVAAQ
jgi:predicted DNA-binding transcriptional regulator AlpA